MAKFNSCVHFCICVRNQATVDFDVDDGVCLYYEKKVVRCKECKFTDGFREFDYATCHRRNNVVRVDGFCSYGERREGDVLL